MRININLLKVILFYVFLAIVLTIILLSCNTEKKLTAKAETFTSKYPKKAHPFFRGKFPCIDTKSDTTIVHTDTTFYVDCPDTVAAAEYFTVHDTVQIYGKTIIRDGKTIKVPVTLPQKVVTVVKTIEDLSRIAEMDILLIEARKKADLYAAKNNHKGKVILWLIVFLVGLSVPYIIKAVKFFKL